MSIYEHRSGEGIVGQDHPADDLLFINQRFEGQTLGGTATTYRHCTFANVSFKDSTLENITFEGCVFVGCYLRLTTLRNCEFPASRFIDCQFVKPNIVGCSFAYARFSGSTIDYTRIVTAMPGEHNLRHSLASNLAIEAAVAGRTRDARQFRLEAIHAREQDFRAAFRHSTDYYADKYKGLDQVRAGVAYLASRANGTIWGYGERAWPLIRNLLILGLIVFPVLLLLAGEDLTRLRGSGDPNFIDCEFVSVANILNNSGLSGVTIEGGWARVISSSEAAVGLVTLGLFITLLFRAVTRR